MLPNAVQRTGVYSCPKEFIVAFNGEVRLKGAEGKVATSLQSHFEASSLEVVLT